MKLTFEMLNTDLTNISANQILQNLDRQQSYGMRALACVLLLSKFYWSMEINELELTQ